MAVPSFNPYRGSIGRFFAGDTSLVGYWQLQGNSWDNSGNGNNGTDTSVAYNQPGFRDGVGSAYFNGSSSNFTLPGSSILQPSQFTLLAWVSPNNGGLLFSNMVDASGGGGSNYRGFWFQPSKSASSTLVIGSQIFNGTSAASIAYYIDTGIPVDGTYKTIHLCGMTYNGSVVKLYVDGKYLGTSTSGSLVYNSTFYPTVCAERRYNPSIYSNYLNCVLSELALFSRPFDTSEISQYYQWATSSPKKSWSFGSSLQLFLQSLTTSGTLSAVINKITIVPTRITLQAITTGTAYLLKTRVMLVDILSSMTGSATITKVRTVIATLSKTITATATISQVKNLLKTISKTITATATIVKKLTLSVQLSVTGTGSPFMILKKDLSQLFSIVVRAAVSILVNFGYIDKYPPRDDESDYSDKYPQ